MWASAALLLALTSASRASGLSLPSFWGSHMVLQRDVPVTLTGTDEPGAAIVVAYAGRTFNATVSAAGGWSVALPAAPASAVPASIVVTSSAAGARVALDDVLVGDVFFCSGQSNMVIQVQDTAQFADAYSEADALGPLLRIFQVALDPADANATAPATNVSAAIPWARAAPLTIRNMSATCYFTGVNAVRARGAPIGLIASAWGGMRIQLFMSPAALAACPSDAAPPLAEQLGAVSGPGAVSVPGASRAALALASAAFAESEFTRLRFGDVGVPSAPSCLYYSMIAPFLALPVASLIWYQGEANVEFPTEYQCLQREMVRDWRASWARVGASPTLPFVYVGLSAWPQDDEGLIPAFRYAAEATTRELPRVGMAVAADIADPASPNHPIHPIWKAELGRRLFLLLDNLLYANASAPLWAPRPVAAEWDAWAPSWGEYHHGMTNTAACHVWRCGGVRVVFDRPVAYRPFYTPAPDPALLRAYDWARGAESGFRGWAGANMTTDWWQPLALSRLSEDGLTLFLNTTWIHPSAAPTILRFGWNDYPLAFPLESRDGAGLPVAPFNISVTVAT